MDLIDLSEVHSLEDLSAHQREVAARLTEINMEHAGQPLPEGLRDEFAGLKDQHDEIDKRVRELEARNRVIAQLGGSEGNREREEIFDTRDSRGSMKERDIYDLSSVRFDVNNPAATRQTLRDRAMRAIETSSFPQALDQDTMRAQVANLVDNRDSADSEIAKRILQTGSPAYRRGFMKYLAGQERSWTTEERTAMAVGAGGTGGYAVVYTLDPTFIKTSNLAVNPFREIARQVTIAGTNEWRGVTSNAVVASRAAEAAEVGDNSPTLTQPDIVVQRVQCFIPVSIELTQDLPSLQSEVAGLIQDAKDVEEATSFTTGTGVAPQAQGLLVGATTTVAAGGTAAFAIADVYATENALGPRFRPNAKWVGNRFIYQKVRQFDTAGGSNMWIGYPNPLQGGMANNPPRSGRLQLDLIGYPSYEDSAMAAALTTASLILVLGDFSYYVIVDRIGLDIEVIPHLFGPTNRFPTGQRGIYAYWRNNAQVMSPNAFAVLKTS